MLHIDYLFDRYPLELSGGQQLRNTKAALDNLAADLDSGFPRGGDPGSPPVLHDSHCMT